LLIPPTGMDAKIMHVSQGADRKWGKCPMLPPPLAAMLARDEMPAGSAGASRE
jgi:hypothetical protein